jgi:hypothetical protein
MAPRERSGECSGVEAHHRRLSIHKRGILDQCQRPKPPIGRLGLSLISGTMPTTLLWDAQSCILCRRAAAFAVFQPPNPWLMVNGKSVRAFLLCF